MFRSLQDNVFREYRRTGIRLAFVFFVQDYFGGKLYSGSTLFQPLRDTTNRNRAQFRRRCDCGSVNLVGVNSNTDRENNKPQRHHGNDIMLLETVASPAAGYCTISCYSLYSQNRHSHRPLAERIARGTMSICPQPKSYFLCLKKTGGAREEKGLRSQRGKRKRNKRIRCNHTITYGLHVL